MPIIPCVNWVGYGQSDWDTSLPCLLGVDGIGCVGNWRQNNKIKKLKKFKKDIDI